MEEFAAGVDVYASFASDIYGFEVNKNDHPNERFVGKTGILGLGFQCGAWKFMNMLQAGMMGPPIDIEAQEAERVVSTYRQKYYRIKNTWWELQNMISTMLPGRHDPVEFRGLVFEPGGTLLMPNGLRLHYPGLDFDVSEWGTAEFTYRPWKAKYKKFTTEKLYGGLLLENIIQCRARIMTCTHMMELARFYRVVMMAHDEIVMCVPNKKAKACLKDALEIMSIPPRWNENCPLAAEGHITQEYMK
jgi:DNA polymerase